MRAALALALVACTGHQQARWATRGESTCPEDRGCELAVGSGEQYHPPDEAWAPPTDDVATIANAKMPEVTCADVGIAIAALEVGNYADPDVRGPIAADHAARCTRQALDRDERTCIYTYPTKDSMAYCAPRMFPEVTLQLVDPRECSRIIDAMRTTMITQLTKAPRDAWDKQIAVVDQSCRLDRWTRQLADCAARSTMATSPSQCISTVPAPLRIKIEDRFAKLAQAR